MIKPLGHKAYGSIPHFKPSRLGPGDNHCEPGQEAIMTKKTRDRHDLIIVQEKLDGSNCSVAKLNGEIIALTRSGYLASTSPYEQHHIFDKWVDNNENLFNDLLNEGERIVGEWLLQAHGTRYKIRDRIEFRSPFVVFDIMVNHDRVTFMEFITRSLPYSPDISIPHTIHIGQHIPLKHAIPLLKSDYYPLEGPEGLIYRCERNGKVDFLCKWVRHDKIDGKYLDLDDGPVYNIDPKMII